MNVMGVDIGTSGCKAAIFSPEGKQIAFSYHEYDVCFTPSGGAELDPRVVIERCMEAIGEAASHVPPDSVSGLGISSQGEAFTPVSEEGHFLSNAMVSSDVRAESYCRKWATEFGIDRLYGITGHTVHPMHTVFKLLWLKDNKPEIWRKAWKFLCFEDLLHHRLGLDPAMGWPLAGRTMLFDVVRHRWSPEILEAIGLREEQLARPLVSGSVAGIVNPSLAANLGLHPRTTVVTGGHDQTCGALGAGAIEPGIAMYATGTVECITPAFDKPVFAPLLCRNNLCTYDHAFPGMYATVAFNLTGGNLLKWFRDEFGYAEMLESRQMGISAYELLMKAASREPSRLLVLPYFTTSGTPYFDARTPGAILGLRLSTKRGDLIRALLEGVTFEMRLNLEILEKAGIQTTELRVIGGGAKSRCWNQLKADVLGKPLVTPRVTEAGCMGAAMLSAAATLGTPIGDLASSWSKEEESYQPDSKLTAWYEERFALYKELYPAIKRLGV